MANITWKHEHFLSRHISVLFALCSCRFQIKHGSYSKDKGCINKADRFSWRGEGKQIFVPFFAESTGRTVVICQYSLLFDFNLLWLLYSCPFTHTELPLRYCHGSLLLQYHFFFLDRLKKGFVQDLASLGLTHTVASNRCICSLGWVQWDLDE